MISLPLDRLAETAALAARDAGALVAKWIGQDITAEHKPGGESAASQVVTEVDRLSQACILRHLQPTLEAHGLGLLTEEQPDDGSRLNREAFWCIDPLDGTQPFLEGIPGCAVSIALVARDGTPLIGTTYDPASGRPVEAVQGSGIRSNSADRTPPEASSHLHLYTDRSFAERAHYPATVRRLEETAQILGLDSLRVDTSGGAVINALRVLDHPPACYFKFPRNTRSGGCLWDYAATACIFREAGAVVCDMEGQPLDLNRPDSPYLNHRGMLFATDRRLADQLLRLND